VQGYGNDADSFNRFRYVVNIATIRKWNTT